MEPVGRLFVRTDGWEWVLGSGDLDMITLWKDVNTLPDSESELPVRFNSTLPRPSNDAQAVLRELKGTHIRSSMLSGRSIGRKERVCGHIGVIRMAGISG